jgi:hypothetical protein
MTVRVYRSTDTGAYATLDNSAGALVAVLDSVLVSGYDLGAVSGITRSGSIATITFNAAHGLVGPCNRVTVAGVDQADYNGEQAVTVASPTALTYTVANSPVTPATGTITAVKAGAGWTLPYTGSGTRAYRMGSGNLRYLYVDDNGTTSARAVGYETMTDISDTSGNAFPTSAQFSGGLYLPKSNTTPYRDWIAVTTENSIYFWINCNGTLTSSPIWFFGDFPSQKAVDAYNTAFCAGTSAQFTSGNGVLSCTASVSTVLTGHYIARTAAQTGTSVTAGKFINTAASKTNAMAGAAGLPYPAMDGGLKYSPIYIHEAVLGDVRGQLPGALAPLHIRPLTHLDTFTGTGDYAGKTYLVLTGYSSGQCFIEISNTR